MQKIMGCAILVIINHNAIHVNISPTFFTDKNYHSFITLEVFSSLYENDKILKTVSKKTNFSLWYVTGSRNDTTCKQYAFLSTTEPGSINEWSNISWQLLASLNPFRTSQICIWVVTLHCTSQSEIALMFIYVKYVHVWIESIHS